MINDLPRNQDLPLFNPHRAEFRCEIESANVPSIDAQADAWFREALALDDPSIYFNDRDHAKIVALTRQAAERHHWKAMLNLASFYINGRDPSHGVEDAVKLVEQAMRLGIPAAYDRMGTYYANGTGVRGDRSKAFAFWQRAAEMGNPAAMTFLAEKMIGVKDNPAEGWWSNISIAIEMMECAFGQGFGEAAYHLAYEYTFPETGPKNTREQKLRALKTLHEGVKLGCEQCAVDLKLEFSDPFNLADMMAPFIDKARAERYDVLAAALRFNPNRRFPNLDKVLPLPPAHLPMWNGDGATLVKAAMGITLSRKAPGPTAASRRPGRAFLDAGFNLRQSGRLTERPDAPLAGYWRPTAHGQGADIEAALEPVLPGLYQRGEPFMRYYYETPSGHQPIERIVWQHWDTIPHHHGDAVPVAVSGLVREVAHNAPLMACPAVAVCPATGSWQPWISVDHPLSAMVNQAWRQVWLSKGQTFPGPAQDWLLPLEADELTWHLIDDAPVNIESAPDRSAC
jgi:hypothetical protein